jgi:hypothetical protein
MRGAFLKKNQLNRISRDVFANKSAVVLEWLLLYGIRRPEFGLREIAGENPVSLGLVHGVIDQLVDNGFVVAKGVRTAKTYGLRDPKGLLDSWRAHYSLVEKCRVWTYRSTLNGRDAIISKLSHSRCWKAATLALHSAAEQHGYRHTNLETVELYLNDPEKRDDLEKALNLEPQDRGYDVLIIQPYYKELLKKNKDVENRGAELAIKPDEGHLWYSPLLLTYLDLARYPVRGEEQADFIARRAPSIKRITTWTSS